MARYAQVTRMRKALWFTQDMLWTYYCRTCDLTLHGQGPDDFLSSVLQEHDDVDWFEQEGCFIGPSGKARYELLDDAIYEALSEDVKRRYF